ncbi:SCO6745 family protein [Amycolatopsis sp. NPDC054798]
MTPARTLWTAIEPLHAIVYFTPEPATAAKNIGLKGWWMGYFAGRAAPLGPIGPTPVTSMFFGFSPKMVARSLPDAWTFATPADVLHTRIKSTEAALSRLLGPTPTEELTTLLEQAATACQFDARPLSAAWSAVPRPTTPLARLWLATTILREHRGDGHVLAAVASGLTGLETTLTHIATGATTREQVQRARGWTDEEWSTATTSLTARGLLDATGLTPAGKELRRTIEETTDRLASAPLEALGPEGVDRVITLATPLSRQIIDNGGVPIPNPMGATRP